MLSSVTLEQGEKFREWLDHQGPTLVDNLGISGMCASVRVSVYVYSHVSGECVCGKRESVPMRACVCLKPCMGQCVFLG